MSYGSLPGKLEQLSKVFDRVTATRPTGQFLSTNAGRLRKQWQDKRSITLQNIPMPQPRDQARFPVGCEVERCVMSVEYAQDDQEKCLNAAFQVELKGALQGVDAIIELQDHWRIDTDVAVIEARRNNEAVKEGREPHPVYHFQRGGHAQDRFALSDDFVPRKETSMGDRPWKALMQYPGPRIPSLPFDPVLAIDFCIGQNDGPLWRALHRFPEYRQVIRGAQEFLWAPFFDALQQKSYRREWLGPMMIV
ncbi:hypothetical protein JMG10_25575 [Nostoc ellipsosporum NOK]|nr:hypothetical protein [Nostoc ellipsosporum NOK]